MTSWVPVGVDRLQEAQEATGLSNERLAREIPVSAKTWERWKKRGEIPADSIPAVARALNLEIRRPGVRPIEIPDDGAANGRGATGEERWQRELTDEVRRQFREQNQRLARIEEQLRLLSSSRSRV